MEIVARMIYSREMYRIHTALGFSSVSLDLSRYYIHFAIYGNIYDKSFMSKHSFCVNPRVALYRGIFVRYTVAVSLASVTVWTVHFEVTGGSALTLNVCNRLKVAAKADATKYSVCDYYGNEFIDTCSEVDFMPTIQNVRREFQSTFYAFHTGAHCTSDDSKYVPPTYTVTVCDATQSFLKTV